MSDEKIYKVSNEVAEHAHINKALYEAEYKRSIDDTDGFWNEKARDLYVNSAYHTFNINLLRR